MIALLKNRGVEEVKRLTVDEKISSVENLPDLASVSQTAAALNVSIKTVYRLVEEGAVRAYRIRGSLRINKNSIRSYLEAYP